MGQLILTPITTIPMVRAGDPITQYIISGLADAGIDLEANDVIVIAQKIVSKAEGRAVSLSDVIASQRAEEIARNVGKDARLVQLIIDESNSILRTKPGTIIVEHKLGFVCANAGIDHSNVDSHVIGLPNDLYLLLPINSDNSAQKIRSELMEKKGMDIGVLVIDSHGRAWRQGVIGTTIGVAGIPGLVDLRGRPDLFGAPLRITQVAAADELAAAASLIMGQAEEGVPVVHVRGFPYPLRESSVSELIRPKNEDLFR